MADFSDISGGDRRAGSEPTLLAAVVHRAPTEIETALTVIIPSFDTHREFQVRRGLPHALPLPVAGDHALVAYADDGEELWLVAWSPAE